MSGPPIIQDMNNGILHAVRAMPGKDLTSDGGSSFAISRREYSHAVAPSNAVVLEKKWFGNRDASQITANRRIAGIGQGSLNMSASQMSFTTSNDTNTARQALNRVRGGGAVVSPKKTKVVSMF